MTGRKKVIQGGTWAGKTFGILPILIDKACKHTGGNAVYTVVAETIPALKGGAIKDFQNIMFDTNRWIESSWNGTDLFYKFRSGVKFEFKSFDSVGKAQAAGKRDKLFINEAPYIAYDIADALIGRTTEDIYIDFNPTSEFWAHTEIMPNKDAEFLLLKYTDNEALPSTILAELEMKLEKAYKNPQGDRNDPNNIKSNYWHNWCRVYIEGEIGSLQGTIFQFNIVPTIPPDAELLGYGMDFGFSVDPTAMVALYRFNKEVYIKEIIYNANLRNIDISNKMTAAGVDPYKPIYCDDADPKTRAELQALGWVNCTRANKDYINASIEILQGFTLNVTESSVNLINELRNYRWKTDKSGAALNEPIDSFNHSIDALRYVAINKLRAGSGQYSISVL